MLTEDDCREFVRIAHEMPEDEAVMFFGGLTRHTTQTLRKELKPQYIPQIGISFWKDIGHQYDCFPTQAEAIHLILEFLDKYPWCSHQNFKLTIGLMMATINKLKTKNESE